MNVSDRDILDWAHMASRRGGSFVSAIGEALLYADDQNFAILRAAAVQLIGKYPDYLESARKEAKAIESGR